jgi:hypothetical protein
MPRTDALAPYVPLEKNVAKVASHTWGPGVRGAWIQSMAADSGWLAKLKVELPDN